MTTLIGPDGLEADAVVPQCLDNQYVSDPVFAKMLQDKLDYADNDISKLREIEFKTEFIRSLVYSSQIIVQRAFLKNSKFLYNNYLPEKRESLSAFAALMRDKAIVPFLFDESSLQDKLDFDLSKEGDRATSALLGEVGPDITCVRLSTDDSANKRIASRMAAAFGAGLRNLEELGGEQRNAMATELFADRSRLEPEGAWHAFDTAIDDLIDYSNAKTRKLRKESSKPLTRQDVYRDNFIVEGGDDEGVVLGRFRQPDQDCPFLLELKKYVDLVYNVNLPDHLNRYTFTPANMPSRMAMQDAPRDGYRHEQVSDVVSDADALESVRRTFMAHSQKAMSLPLLRNLSVADVMEIRGLAEWNAFKDSQTHILKHPLQCLDRLEQFQEDFNSFQRAISDWYNRKYQSALTEEKYCSYISFALSLAGKLIVAGSDLSPLWKASATAVTDELVKNIPKKVKGYAAKLVVGVYDIGKQQLDADRTYTIELMQTGAELLRDDVVKLLESIHRQAEAAMPSVSLQPADQGVQ